MALSETSCSLISWVPLLSMRNGCSSVDDSTIWALNSYNITCYGCEDINAAAYGNSTGPHLLRSIHRYHINPISAELFWGNNGMYFSAAHAGSPTKAQPCMTLISTMHGQQFLIPGLIIQCWTLGIPASQGQYVFQIAHQMICPLCWSINIWYHYILLSPHVFSMVESRELQI